MPDGSRSTIELIGDAIKRMGLDLVPLPEPRQSSLDDLASECQELSDLAADWNVRMSPWEAHRLALEDCGTRQHQSVDDGFYRQRLNAHLTAEL